MTLKPNTGHREDFKMENLFEGQGIIISAERSELNTKENAERSADLVHLLLDIVGWDARIIPVNGRFQGTREQSYVVLLNPITCMDNDKVREITLSVITAAYLMDQETVIVFGSGSARLLEIPEVMQEGDIMTVQELTTALQIAYHSDTAMDYVSDPMTFCEVPKEDVYDYNLDYTEIDGVYYWLDM
jgi:hypothetical protein